MPPVRSYDSEDITVRFDTRRCIHAAECVHGLPAVFDADARPWIDADGAKADDIVEVIHACPSGALTYERHDGGPAEPVTAGELEIRTADDGPLFLRGDVKLVDGDGTPLEAGSRVALCRCGASKNKPFCDNSHVDIDFSTTS